MRWQYGAFLRLIRLLGIFVALLVPGMYIALTLYHQEAIPTDLLAAIVKARENVPFPTILEVLIMEISFELIREAGLRMPGLIGNTLGIVGALILGQAAVAGVPFLAPVAPKTNTNPDIIIRQPIFKQKDRPDFNNPVDSKRTGPKVRGWIKKRTRKDRE